MLDSHFIGAFIDVMIQPFFKALVDWDAGRFTYPWEWIPCKIFGAW
jgi:hypothetical protein